MSRRTIKDKKFREWKQAMRFKMTPNGPVEMTKKEWIKWCNDPKRRKEFEELWQKELKDKA